MTAIPTAVPGGPGESASSRPPALMWSQPVRAAPHLDQHTGLLLKLGQDVIKSNLPQLGIVILIEKTGEPAYCRFSESLLAVIHRSTRFWSALRTTFLAAVSIPRDHDAPFGSHGHELSQARCLFRNSDTNPSSPVRPLKDGDRSGTNHVMVIRRFFVSSQRHRYVPRNRSHVAQHTTKELGESCY